MVSWYTRYQRRLCTCRSTFGTKKPVALPNPAVRSLKAAPLRAAAARARAPGQDARSSHLINLFIHHASGAIVALPAANGTGHA